MGRLEGNRTDGVRLFLYGGYLKNNSLLDQPVGSSMVRISVGSLGWPMPASFSAQTWNWTSVPSMTSVTLYLQSGPEVLPHFTQRVPSFSFFSMEYLKGGVSNR